MTTDKTPATLATAKHGGCVQLGDGPWPEIDAILADAYSAGAEGLQFGGIARRAAVRAALAALAAQPSPGGQVDSGTLWWLQDAINTMAEGGNDSHVPRLQALHNSLAARQPVYVQGSDELRARTDGERSAYMEGLEEGKKIAARQPVGQDPVVYWVVCDAQGETPYIKHDPEDGNLCFFATESEAVAVASRTKGAGVKRVEYYKAPRARQPVGELHLPPDGFYKIVFDDAEVPDESFARSGALDAALRRFEQISERWNAHLFVRFANNTRDCTVPNATPAQAVDLGQIIEQIAQQWNGCSYDAVGETIDVGQAIRAAGKRLIDSHAEVRRG